MARKKINKVISIILVVVLLVLAVVYREEIKNFIKEKLDGEKQAVVLAEGEISFHFMSLGNANTGDCTYIKAGDVDILIDAGSRANSVDDITKYINNYVTDNTLEYVIVTHADQDHIAGFASSDNIFERYECENIIDFTSSNKELTTKAGNPTLYAKYLENRDEEVGKGAKHFTALECYNNQNGGKRIYEFSSSMKMEILYNYFYDHKAEDENNYSVCVLFSHGEKHFIFTGDLELEGEQKLVEFYGKSLPKVELYKAGHHGSKTSSNLCLLEVIQPEICVVCCCAGSVEYTQNLENTFPTQKFIDRISEYTDKVYVSIAINVELKDGKYKEVGDIYMLNGNIVVRSMPDTLDEQGKAVKSQVQVECSNNNTILKDTEWFNNNRELPPAWKN